MNASAWFQEYGLGTRVYRGIEGAGLGEIETFLARSVPTSHPVPFLPSVLATRRHAQTKPGNFKNWAREP